MGLFDRKNKDEQQGMEQNPWADASNGNSANPDDSLTTDPASAVGKFDSIPMVGLGEDLREDKTVAFNNLSDIQANPDSTSEFAAFNADGIDTAPNTPKKERKPINKKRLGIVLGVIVGVLVAVYLGMSIFFMSHFGFNSSVSDQDVSFKTVAEVEQIFIDDTSNYVLTIEERANDGSATNETINGHDIDIKYTGGDGQVQSILDSQNAFAWPLRLFLQNSENVGTVSFSYDQDKFTTVAAALHCMDNSQAVYPQNAYAEFNGTTYQAHPEVLGNVVDTEKTLQVLRDTIASGKTELNLSDAGCYIAPEITSKSQSLLDQIALLDKYVPFALTYTFTDGTTEQLSGQTVFGWLTINEDGSYTVNEDAVSAWLDDFCNRHTTVGRERTFTSVDGNTYTVSGGTYGWSVDYDQEYESILNMLNTKQSETREPYWGRTAAVSNATGTEPDWGDTYLDLNLTTQHVYYIQGGQLVFDADVVTGLPDAKHRTPDGVYYISEKLSPKTLTGEIQSNGEPEYKTVVKYWMRVTNSGVGFHDATWQSAFGGTRYITHGSHGCINMSYSEVAELYSMVEVGCPVVSHY